jgi:hypothetical protein
MENKKGIFIDFFFALSKITIYLLLLIKMLKPMKKLALLFSVLFAVSLVFSSCKSHEKCPAYSKANHKHYGKRV